MLRKPEGDYFDESTEFSFEFQDIWLLSIGFKTRGVKIAKVRETEKTRELLKLPTGREIAYLCDCLTGTPRRHRHRVFTSF